MVNMAITAITSKELRDNFKKYADDVSDYDDALIITRPKRQNVVVISEKEFNSIQETNHLLKNANNRKNLMDSIQQAERGNIKLLTPEEFEAISND